jgi:RimJ/RimL family protein N-acetyltransferase
MLTIRAAQLAAFRVRLLPVLAARTTSYLRMHHSVTAARMSDADLDATVARSLARGLGYELTWESSLVCFAVLALEIGPAFDRHPRIRAALHDTGLPPDDRFARMLETISEADWQDARALGVAHDTDPFELVPVGLAHVPALPDLLRDTGAAPPLPPDDVAAWVARSVRARAGGREFAFVIAMPADIPVGMCTLRGLEGPGSRGELGYWVGRSHQNRGYATTAARRIVAFGFARLGLAIIDAAIAPDNAASRRVLEKLGALRAADGDADGAARAVTYRLRVEDWRALTY